MATNEKILNTRIALKIDTLENWLKSSIILKKGEVAFATQSVNAGIGMTEPVVMVKIGNGNKTFAQLDWNFHAKASDVLAACKTEAGLKTFVEGVIEASNLATAKDLNDLTTRVGTVEGKVGTLEGKVSTLEGNIATLNGNAETEGSVAHAIAAAITALNLDTTYVKVADLAAERTKLAGISAGANKVEASETNGNIKIDGTETVVYNDTALAGRVATLEGYFGEGDETVAKQIETAVNAEKEAREKAINDLDDKIGDLPTEGTTVVGYVDEKAAAASKALEDAVKGIEEEAAKHAVKTEVEAALALKADKSVVDGMYTNTKIDELVQGAKDYADANDANTEYHVEYDSENKKIKLVAGADASKMEIDATEFIKDGMISNVTIGADNDLVITFNTDSGKEDIILPLDQLVDIYTGVEGDRVKVTVNADKSISADLIAGSITKDYLDTDVQASLGKADTALQEHQDISHLATQASIDAINEELAKKANNFDVLNNLGKLYQQVKDEFESKTDAASHIATAKQEAIDAAATDAQSKVDALANGAVKTNADAIENITKEGGLIATAEFNAKAYAEEKASAAAAAVETKLTKLETEKVDANTAAIGTINATLATHGDIVTHNVAEFATKAQGDKADTAVQTITAPAGTDGKPNGLKVARKGNDVTLGFDPDVVFVFDCGNSGVVAE